MLTVAGFQQTTEIHNSVRLAAMAIIPANGCRIPFLFCQKQPFRTVTGGKTFLPPNAYAIPYTRGALIPNNGDISFLEEREGHMLAFLIHGISQLTDFCNEPDIFETYRQLLITCDRHAVKSQIDVEWTSPFNLLWQLHTKTGFTRYADCDLDCTSPEYTCWSELVYLTGNTRDVIKVLRNMIGSCCFVGDCINLEGRGVVWEKHTEKRCGRL